jgi:tetratricopeptide (TPR) repeat protein
MSILDRFRAQEAIVRSSVRGSLTATWLAHVVLAWILFSPASIAVAEVAQEVDRINHEVERLVAKGWLDDAMVLAEKAVRLGESELPEEHPAFVEALSNLAGVCRRTDDDDRAKALYEKVLAIKERTSGPDDPGLADCLDDLAAVYKAERSFDKADSLYQRALGIREKALGPEDPGLVGPLIDLAGLYQIRQDYPQADSALKRAIEIQEKTLGPDHPELVTPLKFRAAVCQARGDHACSKALLDRALEIERQAARRLPPADPARGAIGITVWANPSAAGAMGGKGRMAAAKVYFIRMDADAEPYAVADRVWPNYSWKEQESLAYRARNLVESNFSEKGDVYLFNAEPGRYVAVGAILVYDTAGQTVAFQGLFSTEIVARTEVTVTPGRMASTTSSHARPRPSSTCSGTDRHITGRIPSGPSSTASIEAGRARSRSGTAPAELSSTNRPGPPSFPTGRPSRKRPPPRRRSSPNGASGPWTICPTAITSRPWLRPRRRSQRASRSRVRKVPVWLPR